MQRLWTISGRSFKTIRPGVSVGWLEGVQSKPYKTLSQPGLGGMYW